MPTLHEQVAELEEELGIDGENENGKESIESPADVAGAAEHEAEPVRQEQRTDRGRNRARTKRGSSSDGETPSDDGEASQDDGGSARQDGGSSRGNADVEQPAEEGVAEEDNSPAAQARKRRLAREAKARENKAPELREAAKADAVAQTPAAAPAAQTALANDDPEPADKDSNAWLKWKVRQQDKVISQITERETQTRGQQEITSRVRGAINEFRSIRDDYVKKNPDFVPAFQFAYNKHAELMKLDHPTWTPQQIVRELDWKLLQAAGSYAKEGINPAEALYDLAIETYGYVPNSGGKTETESSATGVATQRPRTDLRTIDSNRRRSATGLTSGGSSGSIKLTKEAVAKMTNGELLNLSEEDWKQLETL
jgi:hypothetical protein